MNFSNLQIYGVVGYDFSDDKRRIYFQNFDSRRVLIPGRRFAISPVADASTFQRLDRPVILLDANITVVWENGVLRFKSFHLAKQLLDLSNFFTEATDEQIEKFISHPRIHCGNAEMFLKSCNKWSRKKIALILRSEVLNNATVNTIQDAASEVDCDVKMNKGKIILPTEKRDLRNLLQFLDENLYRGLISQRRLLSSGKRELK